MGAAAMVDDAQWQQIAEVVREFGVAGLTEVRAVPKGLMNRNWRVAAGTQTFRA